MKKTGQGLETVDIKGKDYVMVNSRVQYFRKNFKEFTLQTVWLKLDEKMAICKAIVKNPEGKIYSTGTAYEISGNSFINKTSFIENCETSAIGRCLGFCDIGIDISIASAEEVGNAIKGQNGKKTVKFGSQRGNASKQGEKGKDEQQGARGKGLSDTPPKPDFLIAGKEVTKEKYIESVMNAAAKWKVDVSRIINNKFNSAEPEDMTVEMLLDFATTVKSQILQIQGKK